MASLVTYVYVRDDHGRRSRFGPGDDVPSWAAAKITNPAAWDSNGGTSDDGAPKPKSKRKPRQKPTEGTTQDAPSSAPRETAQSAADRQAAEADANAAESAPGAGGSE